MNVPAESSTLFWAVFNDELSQTKARLVDVKLAASDLDSLRSHALQMQVYATESTAILPPYDIRRTQELLEDLGKELHDADIRLKPKKKFAFSKKSSVPAAPVAPVAPVTATTSPSSSSSASAPMASCHSVRDLSSPQTVVLTEQQLGRTVDGILPPLLITNCSNVVVSAKCLLGAVRLENLSHCRVYLGPCSTSVYLEDCTHCVVFLASHQLRIHKCTSCRLHVRVNSHPIIEDCSDMGFAPYRLTYAICNAHMHEAALQDASCWDNVVDFRWHRSTHSPNWFSIAPAEQANTLEEELRTEGWSVLEDQALVQEKVPMSENPPLTTVFAAASVSVSGIESNNDDDEEL